MQRHLRLSRKEDFAQLQQTGHVWRHPFLILSFAPNCLVHNRYGFITSKRLGGAVVRNRVRRLLREAVRSAHPNLVPGHDIVFIACRPIVGQPYQAVHQAVIAGLHQVSLWTLPTGEQKT